MLAIRFTTFTARQLVDLAVAHGPLFAPGARQHYSNTDYILLGMVIDRVTGRSYRTEIQRRIIAPLGLTDSVMPGTDPFLAGPHSHVYVPASEAADAPPVDVTVMNPSVAGAAGELISTSSDLNRFLRALVTGRLLRPAELRQMTAGHGLGLGVEIATLGCGVRIIGHGLGGPGFLGFAFTTADGTRQLSLTAAVWGRDRSTLPARVTGAQLRVLNAAFCPPGTPSR